MIIKMQVILQEGYVRIKHCMIVSKTNVDFWFEKKKNLLSSV